MRASPFFSVLLAVVYNWPAVYNWPTASAEAPQTSACVLVFTATWCGPCQTVKGHLASIKTDGKLIVEDWGAPRAAFFIVDVDKHPDIWKRWKDPKSDQIPQFVRCVGNEATHYHTGVIGKDAILKFRLEGKTQ